MLYSFNYKTVFRVFYEILTIFEIKTFIKIMSFIKNIQGFGFFSKLLEIPTRNSQLKFLSLNSQIIFVDIL